jgi:hypothetical protein
MTVYRLMGQETIENVKIQQLKRILYQRYLEHGLVDIYIGVFSLTIYIAGFIGPLVFSIHSFGGLFGYSLWRKIILPRLGYVNWGGIQGFKRNSLQMYSLFVFAISAVFAVALIFIGPTYPSDWQVENYRIILGIICLVLFSIPGLLSGVQRFYFYGTIALVIFNFSQLFDISVEICFAVVGIILLANGFGLFLRFLKTHPTRSLEGVDVE